LHDEQFLSESLNWVS